MKAAEVEAMQARAPQGGAPRAEQRPMRPAPPPSPAPLPVEDHQSDQSAVADAVVARFDAGGVGAPGDGVRSPSHLTAAAVAAATPSRPPRPVSPGHGGQSAPRSAMSAPDPSQPGSLRPRRLQGQFQPAAAASGSGSGSGGQEYTWRPAQGHEVVDARLWRLLGSTPSSSARQRALQRSAIAGRLIVSGMPAASTGVAAAWGRSDGQVTAESSTRGGTRRTLRTASWRE